MAMVVDKARRDYLTADIDDLIGRARQLADLGDLAALDRDVTLEGRHPRAIDDAAVFDQDIVRHRGSSVRGAVQPFIVEKTIA